MRIEEIVSTNRKVGLGFRHEPVKPSFHGHFPFYAPKTETITTSDAGTNTISFTGVGSDDEEKNSPNELSTKSLASKTVACEHVGQKLDIKA